MATPLVYEGLVYMVNNGGILTALDGSTGERVKQGRLTGAFEGYFASPVAADGKIYLLSEAGKLVVVRAGRDWQQLSLADLGEDSFSTPALSGGRLYVRTQEHLWCLSDDNSPGISARVPLG